MPPVAPAPRQPFEGFGPGALDFFTVLAAHQTRAWFLANKATHDIPLTGDAKRSLFRIHRDVRFSRDKSPYKTNAGATLTRDGAKMARGVLYIQVGGAEGSFMAVGFYGPEPKDLHAIRAAIAADPDRWLGLQAALAGAGLAFSMTAAQTRPPRGFDAPQAVAGAVKYRNFIVMRPTDRPERGCYRRFSSSCRMGMASMVLASRAADRTDVWSSITTPSLPINRTRNAAGDT